ncbi:MAG TPA: lysoplasmalogenase family protein [Spirochaetota bacterium]|nr:lysoplasmalogenase family protein [Spirochaetota bacterium]
MSGTCVYSAALVLGIAATILFLVVRVKKGGLPGVITKATASVLFIATACAAIVMNLQEYAYGLLIVLGLVCGLLGDIWLDLKYVYPQDNDTYLYAGFYSFFTGHLFFITAIFLSYKWTPWTMAISVIAALIGAAGATLMEKPMKLSYGKFRATCFIYGFILMLTASSSVVAAFATGETAWIVMSAGGVLFLLSDLVLSGTYFGEGKNTPAYVVANHVLYYAAQFVIASSILFVGN